jgi:hypothetical protein
MTTALRSVQIIGGSRHGRVLVGDYARRPFTLLSAIRGCDFAFREVDGGLSAYAIVGRTQYGDLVAVEVE